jgi:glutaredoxin-like protein NrdH
MLTVYSKPACPFCNKAKNLLETKGIEFEVVDISKDSDSRDFLVESGYRTVPQIFKGSELFVEGGFHGLSKLTDEDINTKLG